MPFLSDLRAMILAGVAALLAIVCVALLVETNGFLWIDGLKDQIEDCARDRNELRDIAKKRNEQREKTGQNIGQAERRNRDADKIAERIEAAPLPGQCVTPPEILEADI